MSTPATPPRRLAEGGYGEPRTDWRGVAAMRRVAVALALAAFVAVCVVVARIDPLALARGLPRLIEWAATAWPPNLNELDAVALRAFETVAIATVGTLAAAAVAAPLSVLIARNVAPSPRLAVPLRAVANACRGIDTVVFAILFVAAVGLGPFAGVLGMLVHSVGVIAKLNAEAIETLPRAPLEAAALTGAGHAKIMAHSVLPAVLPNLASVSLYDFQRLLTLSAAVLVMVAAIDRLSAWLRRRLV